MMRRQATAESSTSPSGARDQRRQPRCGLVQIAGQELALAPLEASANASARQRSHASSPSTGRTGAKESERRDVCGRGLGTLAGF